jgi:DmsE family decaheme c-type cytochrome
VVDCGSGAVDFARLNKKFLCAGAFALIWVSLLGLGQPAGAQEALSVAAVNATLRGDPTSSAKPIQARQENTVDPAFSALTTFAQQIVADEPRPATGATSQNSDDQVYSALRAFAQRVGGTQPESVKDQPKLAAADNMWDALTQSNKGSSSAPTTKPRNGPVAGGKQSSAPVDATYVGAKVCATCHSSAIEEFGHTLMGRIGKTQKGKFDCENCHGPGSAHVKAGGGRGVGGIISFRPDDQSRTADENNAVCLNCHLKGDRTNWPGSTHETRGLMCTNCHTVMKEVSRKHQLKTAFEADTCFQCHKDRRAQMFRSSHMPLREGKITCSDCHNPHGSITEALLKEDSINDNCYKCHAEKRGPFLFEHEPVRESCLNCHDPHGTINEYSLKLARPRLCFECHTLDHGAANGPNNFGFGASMGRSCQNCHTQVHGSNSPAGGAFQR